MNESIPTGEGACRLLAVGRLVTSSPTQVNRKFTQMSQAYPTQRVVSWLCASHSESRNLRHARKIYPEGIHGQAPCGSSGRTDLLSPHTLSASVRAQSFLFPQIHAQMTSLPLSACGKYPMCFLQDERNGRESASTVPARHTDLLLKLSPVLGHSAHLSGSLQNNKILKLVIQRVNWLFRLQLQPAQI